VSIPARSENSQTSSALCAHRKPDRGKTPTPCEAPPLHPRRRSTTTDQRNPGALRVDSIQNPLSTRTGTDAAQSGDARKVIALRAVTHRSANACVSRLEDGGPEDQGRLRSARQRRAGPSPITRRETLGAEPPGASPAVRSRGRGGRLDPRRSNPDRAARSLSERQAVHRDPRQNHGPEKPIGDPTELSGIAGPVSSRRHPAATPPGRASYRDVARETYPGCSADPPRAGCRYFRA
jgi:hypothetical protein